MRERSPGTSVLVAAAILIAFGLLVGLLAPFLNATQFIPVLGRALLFAVVVLGVVKAFNTMTARPRPPSGERSRPN